MPLATFVPSLPEPELGRNTRVVQFDLSGSEWSDAARNAIFAFAQHRSNRTLVKSVRWSGNILVCTMRAKGSCSKKVRTKANQLKSNINHEMQRRMDSAEDTAYSTTDFSRRQRRRRRAVHATT